MLYEALSPDVWFVRARVLDEDGNPRSAWAESRFDLKEPVYEKPSVLVLEAEPVGGDQLTLVWPPAPNVSSWRVAVGWDPDFASLLTYEVSQSVLHLDLSPWRGAGTLYLKVRAVGDAVDGPWSDVVAVAYDRPVYHHYSLIHLPTDEAWRVWLQVETLDDPNPEVWMHYRDPRIQGAPTVTRLDLNDGNWGVRRILMTGVTRGAPVLVTSSAKLNLSLSYENGVGVHGGGFQLREQDLTQRADLTGLPEKSGPDQIILSALAAANHSESPMELNLLMTARDWTTGEYVTEREVTLHLEPMSASALMLRDLLPRESGEPIHWAVSVKACANTPGLALIGAHFTQTGGQVSSFWRQAVTR